MDDEAIGQVGERLQGYMTLAVTVAARVVEMYAHRRQQEAEDARRQGEAFARQVEAQQRSEAVAARYELRQTAGRPEWWNTATPEQAAAAYATARSYGQLDPELGGMARFMAGEIERRYGVDAEGLVVREEQRAADIRERAEAEARLVGQEAASQAEAERQAADIEAEIVRHEDVLDKLPPELRAEFADVAAGTGAATGGLQGLIDARAGHLPDVEELMATPSGREAKLRQSRAETVEAVALVAEADLVDAREQRRDALAADGSWDDAARHDTLSRRLAAAMPDQTEARSARLTIDAAQGTPAAAATGAKQATKAPPARSTQGKGVERAIGGR